MSSGVSDLLGCWALKNCIPSCTSALVLPSGSSRSSGETDAETKDKWHVGEGAEEGGVTTWLVKMWVRGLRRGVLWLSLERWRFLVGVSGRKGVQTHGTSRINDWEMGNGSECPALAST